MPTKKKASTRKKTVKQSTEGAIARMTELVAKTVMPKRKTKKKVTTKKVTRKVATKKAPAKRGRKLKGYKTPKAQLLKKHQHPNYAKYLEAKSKLAKEMFS